MDPEARIVGSILGTAVGDAIGLPCEGLSKQRQQAIFGHVDRMRLLFGRGMVSDDTEHTIGLTKPLSTDSADATDEKPNVSDSFSSGSRICAIGVICG